MEKINYRKDCILAEDVIAANKPYVHIDIWDRHLKRQLHLDYIYYQAVKCLDNTELADKLNAIVFLLPHPVDVQKLPENKRNLEFDLWSKCSWYEVMSFPDYVCVINKRTKVVLDIYFIVGMSDANTKAFRTKSKLNLVHIGLETYRHPEYVEQEAVNFINKDIARHISQDTSILRTTNNMSSSNLGEELTATGDLNAFLQCWLRITTPMELKRLQEKLSECYLDVFASMKLIKHLENTLKEKYQQIGIEYIPDILECHRNFLDNLLGDKYGEEIEPKTIRLPDPEKIGEEQTYTEYTLENYKRWTELQD